MKKFISILLASMLLVAMFAIPASADAQAFGGVFNPDESVDGDKAVIYKTEDTAGAWWARVALEPAGDNLWKVVAMNNPDGTNTGTTPLAVPSNGFVFAIHYNCTIANLRSVIVSLGADDYVTITGLDLANETIAADATITKSARPANLLTGKDAVISGAGKGYGNYNADLTDGKTTASWSWDKDTFFGFYYGDDTAGLNTEMQEDGTIIGTAIYDLGGEYNLSKIAVHTFTGGSAGIADCGIKAFVDNGDDWTEIDVAFNQGTTPESTYWAEINISNVKASKIKIQITLASAFAMIDEIEAFGTPVTADDGEDDTDTNTSTPSTSTPSTSTPSTSTPSTGTPATGDASSMIMFAVIALVAIAGSAVVIRKRG